MTTIKKKGSELVIGDVMKEDGIILEIDYESDFFEGKPTYVYFNISDSYYGPNATSLDLDEEFEIYTDRANINKYFRSIDCDLSKYIANMVGYRIKLRALQEKHLKRLKQKDRENIS